MGKLRQWSGWLSKGTSNNFRYDLTCMCIQQIQQSHQYLAVASDQLRWVFCVRNRNIYLVMELCSGGELFDRIIEWLDKCSFGRRNGSVGCTLRWVYLNMGYPIPSIGLSMTDLSLFKWPFDAIWRCSPFSDTPDWWTWSSFGFQKFKVVQSWGCFRAW